jgi:hypothetical protein
LIGLGIVFLLNNLDILPWSLWGTLWRFWPVILIIIGLEIILTRSNVGWGVSLAVGVVVVGLIVGLAVAMAPAGLVRVGSVVPQTGSVVRELGDIREAQADISFGGGRLEVGSLPASSKELVLVDYQVEVPGRAPKIDLEAQEGRGVLRITGQDSMRIGPGSTIDRWELRLSRRIPLDLTLRLGATEGRIDLSDLRVRSLELDVGASSVTVRFPREAGATQATVRAGAASLTLEIPPEVGVRVTSEAGLASVEVSPRFSQTGNTYITANYQTAFNRLDLELKTGASSVTIR